MANILQGVHDYTREGYIPPAEPEVRRKLEWFQDQKLGLMMHFGSYAQAGTFESWPLSDEDAHWSRRFVDWTDDPARVKEDIFGLARSFNPIRFQPEKWARLARECGFRYYLLTTKHHDGFCLWNTKYTDYRSTAPMCAYHAHPNADIVRAAFDAMRREGIAIGAYFSKADWHCPDYWSDTTWNSRNSSYNPADEPERWERFVRFTQAQLLELGEEYGPLDILWLDAGWVNPKNGQDIRLGEVVRRLRERTPGLLVADRTVGGEYENYVTPEQTVPPEPLGIPWESCVSLGTGFSYRYDDAYKTPRQIIHLLLDIVCKGGNLALNLAPQPDGRLPDPGVAVLRTLGGWLNTYGEGIYGTRPVAPYREGSVAFTQKGNTVYAFLMLDEGERLPLVAELPLGRQARAVRLMGYGDVSFVNRDGLVKVDLPKDLPLTELPPAVGFACELA